MAKSPVIASDIIPERVPFIDQRTGLIARPWFLFLLNLFKRLDANVDPLTFLGTAPTENNSASMGSQDALEGVEPAPFVPGSIATVISIPFILGGTGVVITTGIKGDLFIPFDCTITGVTLLVDQVGSIVVDIWKDTYANYPPTVADTITASAKPTITAADKSSNTTLVGWTRLITAGDTLRFKVDSCATITRCTLTLTATKGL